MNVAYNIDCMEYMRGLPDGAFELAIVDPPYGLGMDRGAVGGSVLAKTTIFPAKKWDIKPNADYFSELIRVSNNQIIWGGNYFTEFLANSPS